MGDRFAGDCLHQHATQIHTIVGLVGAGIGIAIVPETARNLHPRGVSFLHILEKSEPVHVALGWQRGKDTPAIRSFRQVALLVVQQMQTRPKKATSEQSRRMAK
ncbi:LysR substrate-binding domain-containing protein [Microvirga sp. 2YAF29]|uniref:LysR substrate-binding domain-containing protein n=1 Tax=Microvirga sp. 2YAF29 TaxID=3233031 RepID=UPI003F99B904